MARRWRWEGNNQLVTTAADTVINGLVLPDTAFEKGETITCVVGHIAIQLVSANITPRRFGLGLMLVDSGIGLTSTLHDPQSDFNHDWIWHAAGILFPHDVGGDYQTVRLFVDNRSMRKIGDDEKLVMWLHGQGAPQNFSWGLRVGVKMA